jgi:nucleoside-diphosphate-sugar epimerase
MVRQARAGRLFAPPDTGGVFSFVHVDDAARAVIAALEHEAPGPVYNVADDVPMSIPAVLTLTSQAVAGRSPRRLPGWLVRVAAPVVAEMVGWRLPLSNARARAHLGWAPRHASVDDGLRTLVHKREAAA